MSQLKLTADGGGGTVAIKGPASTTGNAAIELTVPGTGNSTLATTATAGKILQVKQTTATGDLSSTSSGAVASGHICSVTPVATGSKFLVTAENISGHANLTSAANYGALYYLYVSVNSGTYANAASDALKSVHINGNTQNWINVPINFNFLASPTYSAGQTVAFQTYFSRGTRGSGAFYYSHAGHSDMNNQVRTLTVMEVAA